MHKNVKASLAGMAGSLRRSSYSACLLSGLRENLSAVADLVICDLQLPLYNEDDDGPAAPQTGRAFREAIAASDGVVIVTPEYNHGIPGVLKNALDWASRPFGQAALIGKPVLVISVSPAFTGGVRAQAQVNETLLAIGARVVSGPQVVIGGIANKIKSGLVADEESLHFALGALDRLIAMTQNDQISQRLLI